MKFSACFQNNGIIVDLAAAITKRGISVFRFGFNGNGQVNNEPFISAIAFIFF
jgi:hypothetical protein